jgi:Mn2+/Fe2+ NRAMP family transporter
MTLSLPSVNPITLLVFVADINAVAAAPFLAVTVLVSSDHGVKGTYVNGRLARTLGWSTVALMTSTAVLVLVV